MSKKRSSIESLRNYVHDNGLCLNPDHYDAKERKIEHVAAPEFDTDVVNKSYVERTIRDSRNEIEESFRTIRRDVQEAHSDVEKVRRNVEKNVTRMSDEIQHLNRDITIRMKNVMTNETLEKSFKMTGRDTRGTTYILSLGNTECRQKVSDESQRLNRNVTDLRQQANDTKDTLVRLFKNDRKRDTIVLALQKVSDESQRLNRNVTDLRQQANDTKDTLKVSDESQRLNRNVTDLRQLANDTKETLERAFKNDKEGDTIVLALQKVSNDIQILHRGVGDLRRICQRKCVMRTRFDI
ncbi:hypothetical protein G5I_12232 [Acromyrmex echinatior]|uniref:Uncharacterized protein n=1 Tax=Acromyrmex echinatior TaxID=103372 RepID=F4X1Q8_ACREC|nr:hypothetical protein G5I_12232 [Acromyrmex echinatior]